MRNLTDLFEVTTKVFSVKDPSSLKWFGQNQNNSGGRFTKPAKNLWIQAISEDEAEKVFDGLDLNMSFCSCCGVRWGGFWNEGSKYPEYYGTPLNELTKSPRDAFDEDIPWGVLYWANGQVDTLKVR